MVAWVDGQESRWCAAFAGEIRKRKRKKAQLFLLCSPLAEVCYGVQSFLASAPLLPRLLLRWALLVLFTREVAQV